MEARRYLLERVDDEAVVQVYADGFAALSLQEKTLAWHLYCAALAGRDIYFDQRHRDGLAMRAALEAILTHGRNVEARVLAEIRRYAKLFWINSGPYNNMTARKFVLALSPEELRGAARAAARHQAGAVYQDETLERLVERLLPMFLDAGVDPVVTNKTPPPGRDLLTSSANNLYEDVAMADVEGYAERHPLNSRLVRRHGRLEEEVYRIGGRYDRQIRHVVSHLEAAIPHAAPPTAAALEALIRFYRSGEESDRVAYDVAWVQDQQASVDTINGFVEVYLDPRGTKGAWEGIVYYVHHGKTQRIRTLASNAQWFEDRMPWEPRFRRTQVQGVSAQAIEIVVETGDAGPVTAVGINLPNDQSIRERHGSKSVSLANVTEAHELATPPAMRSEFSWSSDEAARAERWGPLAQELTTEMHEVIGHGSGRMSSDDLPAPHLLLKEHYSTIEEARADLVALYFLPDPELAALGVIDGAHQEEIVRTEFEHYARTALLQLRRVRDGAQLEEDHMRNRQLVVAWLQANTTAIDTRRRDGKTFHVVTDPAAFRAGAGRLLAEVQRIKAEGDYDAARALVEAYGVHFDPALRDEIVQRVDALGLPSYTAFVMPRLEPRLAVSAASDRPEIVDVEISYPCDLEVQMLEYAAFTAAAPV